MGWLHTQTGKKALWLLQNAHSRMLACIQSHKAYIRAKTQRHRECISLCSEDEGSTDAGLTDTDPPTLWVELTPCIAYQPENCIQWDTGCFGGSVKIETPPINVKQQEMLACCSADRLTRLSERHQ